MGTLDWEAKKAALATAAAALQAANPHLVPIGECRDGLIAATKNIRIELARAFPGVKFSVKSRRFSGGDAIDVRWTDGPMTAQVDDIIDRYAAGSFDGMTDCYNYSRDAWTDAFGDGKYISSYRDYSDAAVAGAIRTLTQKYGEQFTKFEPTVEKYRSGKLWTLQFDPGPPYTLNLQNLIGDVLQRRTWALNKAPKPVAMVDAEGVAA